MLDDYQSAPIAETLKAMLGFLEKLTHRPDEVEPADIDALRAAGISDRAIEDAGLICAAFHVITRLADSFDFEVLDEAGFARGARALLRRGYA